MENLRCIIEIIVALGALGGFIACIPIIRNWFNSADLKTIKIDDDIVVFSSSGTRIRLTMAFLSKNEQAIITNITAKLKHEDGAEKQLTWRYMNEKYGDFSYSWGVSGTNEKFQRALVLIVSTTYFVEKDIFLYDEIFRSKENELKQKVREKIILLDKQKKNITEIKREEEYIKLLDHFDKCFFWKEGKYNVEIIVSLSNKKVCTKKLEFDLTPVDILLLQSEYKETYSKRLEKEFLLNKDIDLSKLPVNCSGVTAKIIE